MAEIDKIEITVDMLFQLNKIPDEGVEPGFVIYEDDKLVITAVIAWLGEPGIPNTQIVAYRMEFDDEYDHLPYVVEHLLNLPELKPRGGRIYNAR